MFYHLTTIKIRIIKKFLSKLDFGNNKKGVAIKLEKCMGLETKDLYRFRPSYSRSNTLLLSGDDSAECVIDCMIGRKKNRPKRNPDLSLYRGRDPYYKVQSIS